VNSRQSFTEIVRDLVARTFVGALFVVLTARLVADYMHTGRVTGLFFVASEALVVVLTIVRRPAREVDRSAGAALLTMLSLIGPPLLRPSDGPALVPDVLTALISCVGLVIVIAGKLTLGRSFGIAPANRGVVARGPYTIVRHPIYAGYLLTHAAALVAYPSAANVTILVGADIALVLRALVEERVLFKDLEYRRYCQRVAWHLVPGLF
jgi:protein-S-isoprenylcysteine O-methyltransferase Ste14